MLVSLIHDFDAGFADTVAFEPVVTAMLVVLKMADLAADKRISAFISVSDIASVCCFR
jgi:hypothetical protein